MGSNFAVNVVAPLLLTHLLMDRLAASASARVVNVTGGDVPSRLELDNLQAERTFKETAHLQLSRRAKRRNCLQ